MKPRTWTFGVLFSKLILSASYEGLVRNSLYLVNLDTLTSDFLISELISISSFIYTVKTVLCFIARFAIVNCKTQQFLFPAHFSSVLNNLFLRAPNCYCENYSIFSFALRHLSLCCLFTPIITVLIILDTYTPKWSYRIWILVLQHLCSMRRAYVSVALLN